MRQSYILRASRLQRKCLESTEDNIQICHLLFSQITCLSLWIFFQGSLQQPKPRYIASFPSCWISSAFCREKLWEKAMNEVTAERKPERLSPSTRKISSGAAHSFSSQHQPRICRRCVVTPRDKKGRQVGEHLPILPTCEISTLGSCCYSFANTSSSQCSCKCLWTITWRTAGLLKDCASN